MCRTSRGSSLSFWPEEWRSWPLESNQVYCQMGGLASLSQDKMAFFPSITRSPGLMDTRSLRGTSVKETQNQAGGGRGQQVTSSSSHLGPSPSHSHSTWRLQACDKVSPMELLTMQL